LPYAGLYAYLVECKPFQPQKSVINKVLAAAKGIHDGEPSIVNICCSSPPCSASSPRGLRFTFHWPVQKRYKELEVFTLTACGDVASTDKSGYLLNGEVRCEDSLCVRFPGSPEPIIVDPDIELWRVYDLIKFAQKNMDGSERIGSLLRSEGALDTGEFKIYLANDTSVSGRLLNVRLDCTADGSNCEWRVVSESTYWY
jgi:hypothetical protein